MRPTYITTHEVFIYPNNIFKIKQLNFRVFYYGNCNLFKTLFLERNIEDRLMDESDADAVITSGGLMEALYGHDKQITERIVMNGINGTFQL